MWYNYYYNYYNYSGLELDDHLALAAAARRHDGQLDRVAALRRGRRDRDTCVQVPEARR